MKVPTKFSEWTPQMCFWEASLIMFETHTLWAERVTKTISTVERVTGTVPATYVDTLKYIVDVNEVIRLSANSLKREVRKAE